MVEFSAIYECVIQASQGHVNIVTLELWRGVVADNHMQLREAILDQKQPKYGIAPKGGGGGGGGLDV